MSLINTMLQELDARRSEAAGGSPFGQQVRAVPKRRRIHPAWWIALVLAVALLAVLGWVALRPPVPAQHETAVRLPLKLDVDLSVTSSSEASEQAAGNQVASLSKPSVTPADGFVPNPRPAPPTEAVRGVAVSPVSPVPEKRTGVSKSPFDASAAAAPLLAPDVSQAPAAQKASVSGGQPRPQDTSTPVVINKQVRELSAHQRADNEYRKAVGLMQQGRNAEAIQAYDEALRLDSQHVDARHALIGALLSEKRQDEALQKAKEGLERDPAQPGFAMIAARLQLEKGELRAAIETLERTLPHASQRADYQAFLAALLQRDGRHGKAMEHYLGALQKSPQNGVWWMGLGISMQAEGKNAEAIEAFKRAKASNTLSPELFAFVEGRLAQLQR